MFKISSVRVLSVFSFRSHFHKGSFVFINTSECLTVADNFTNDDLFSNLSLILFSNGHKWLIHIPLIIHCHVNQIKLLRCSIPIIQAICELSAHETVSDIIHFICESNLMKSSAKSNRLNNHVEDLKVQIMQCS